MKYKKIIYLYEMNTNYIYLNVKMNNYMLKYRLNLNLITTEKNIKGQGTFKQIISTILKTNETSAIPTVVVNFKTTNNSFNIQHTALPCIQ